MKKNSPNRLLLLTWLRTALDEQLYKGLGWNDKENGIFYVTWTHKSADQWTEEDLEVFVAWAAYKGKLKGKNQKQVKATFRCALNSKKDHLKELPRGKSKRYWQFIDPSAAEKDSGLKKGRKVSKTHTLSATSNEVESNIDIGFSPLRISSCREDKISRSTKLPAFESWSNFEPLTPPDQANEMPYNCTESDISEEETSRKETLGVNSELVDRMTPSISFSNVGNNCIDYLSSNGSVYEAENSSTGILPPFGSFCSFRMLTPPPQMNEVHFNPTECSTNYTPPPDHNRLTPPQKTYQSIPRDSFYQFSTDVWQPNCWPVPQADENFKYLNQFSGDLTAIYKTPNQEYDNSVDFVEMDQHVPEMVISRTDQIRPRNAQNNLTSKIEHTNEVHNLFLRLKLDEDDLMSIDVDQEAYDRLVKELDRHTPS